MLFTASQKRLRFHNNFLHLTDNNDALNKVENEKIIYVLALITTWSIHINFIAKNISSNLWLSSNLKDYLSHIDYCSTT